MLNKSFIFDAHCPISSNSKWLTDNSKGTAQKGIYLNALSLMIIPIPPLAEQARIVEQIHIAYKQLDLISNALL